MITLSFSYFVASIALAPLAHAAFNVNSQSNIAVYWGQNSYGQSSSQQRLSVYCSNTKLNIIPLAFMNGIQTPITNFANAGDNCTAYAGTQLLNCPQLEEDIKICQTTYSKTIILSLGGATYTEGGFSSPSAAQAAATNVWNLFGPNTAYANRPFRTAIIDGFDFDFEAATQNGAPFAQKLRDLMDAAGGKKYYLSAAPQCPYPDAALNEILSNVAMDFVLVQFYNNWCGASGFSTGTQSQERFNMDTWDNWAKTTSKNPNVKIFLGVPANSGAGGGYVSANDGGEYWVSGWSLFRADCRDHIDVLYDFGKVCDDPDDNLGEIDYVSNQYSEIDDHVNKHFDNEFGKIFIYKHDNFEEQWD
ncbi:putative Glycoside hydrolase superfamily [Seiridium unicorne]|uniref:chitinase n=1 Tax=Seiridium unicorne TaxID=138068 RepID=A0ABR2UZF0_9PEZI